MFLRSLKRDGLVSLLIAACGIVALVMFSTRFVDAERADVERRIVSSALNDAMASIKHALGPQTFWDEAYDRMVAPVAAEWAEANLGPYASQTSAISAVLVFDDRDRAIYRYAVGRASYRPTSGILALVRQARRSRGAPAAIASGFILADGKLYLAAASLVQPNDSRRLHPLARHAVQVYLQEFNPDRIRKVQSDFNLSRVRVDLSGHATGEGIRLRDSGGQTVAWLNWQPQTPGTRYVLLLLPVALFCFVALGFLQWRNISKWHRAVEALEQSKAETEQLRQDSWARTMFLANISHEFRTPLNAILGFSEMIATDVLGRPADPKYRGYARDIHAVGKQLLEIVDGILLLSQERTDAEATGGECMPSTVVADALPGLQSAASAKSVSLVIENGLNDAVIGITDKMFRQILVNLAANAVKFSGKGGLVRIVLCRKGHGSDARALLIVQDRGCGIEADKLPYLGRPFYRAQGSFSHGEGRGLGLSIVKRIVHSAGGSIDFASELGTGTTVTVSIPLLRRAMPDSGIDSGFRKSA